MKKKLLFGLLTLPLAFTMSANAEKINSEYIHYDYDLGITKIQHVNQGYTNNYLDIYGLTDANVSESNVKYWLYTTKKGDDVLFAPNGTDQYKLATEDTSLLNKDGVYAYHYTLISGSSGSRANNNGVSYVEANTAGRWFFDESFNNFYVIKEVRNPETTKTTFYVSPSMSAVRATFEHNYKYQLMIKGANYDSPTKESTIFSYMPYKNTGLQGHVKIGKLTETSILNKFSNDDSEAYSSLLTYAKNNDGKTFDFTYGEHNDFDATSMTFDDESLYYVYVYYDNDGSLLDYSDVVITKASSNKLALFNDYNDYRTNEVSSTTTTTPKNPKTGVEDMIYIVPIVLLGGFAAVALTKRKTSFR